jgi:Ca2+-binding RTX toxin-like protein
MQVVVLIFLMMILSFTLANGIFCINLFAQSEGDNLPDENFKDGSNCSDRSDGRLQVCENTTALQFPDLVGNEGDDVIYGKFGLDRLYGMEGNDVLDGGENDDELYGGQGDDNLYGSLADDFLFGGEDNDVLVGYFGNDYISGDNGADELYGDNGNDILKGGSGPDYFDCGLDRDTVLDYHQTEGDILSQNCESVTKKEM